MAIAFDAASSSVGSGVTSVTFPHTTSGANRALIVGVSFWDGTAQSISGVTYAGTAMTNIGGATDSADDRAQQWKLSNPATGTNNVIVSFSGSVHAVCGAVSFTGAHQTTASLTGTQATATGNSGTPSVNVSSASGEIVIDTLGFFVAIATVGAGQTQRWNATASLEYGAGSTEAGASTTTMSWTLDDIFPWALVGVGVKPAPAGTAVDPTRGLVQFKGQVPTVRDIDFAAPAKGLLQFKGLVPTTAKVKSPSAGRWLYVGQVPTVESVSVASPTAGKFWFVGQVPSTRDLAFKSPSAGNLWFKGYVPGAEVTGHKPQKGLFRFVGQVPVINSVKGVSPFAHAFWLVGQPPTIAKLYWDRPDPNSSTWSTVSATAAAWSAVGAASLSWGAAGSTSSGWSAVNSQSSTWSPV